MENNNKDTRQKREKEPADNTVLIGYNGGAENKQREHEKNAADPKKNDAAVVGAASLAYAKRAKKSKRNRRAKSFFTLVLSIILALLYMAFVLGSAGIIGYYSVTIANDIFGFVKSTEIVEINIPENATVSEIVEIYAKNDIIEYPFVFAMYANSKGYVDRPDENGDMHAVYVIEIADEAGNITEKQVELDLSGTKQITPASNYDSLLLKLHKEVEYGTVWITIPEGHTVDEIIDLFVEKGIGTKERFVEVINNYPFDYDFVRELDENPNPDRFYRLEGYLFPDTYEFYLNSTEERVIYKLLDNFDKKYLQTYKERADELGMTTDQVIMLASIIEKETRYANEYELVSSVFHNRLRDPANHPKLESDATIMYAIHHDMGERPNTLTSTDYETPYNTYKYPGFPPGPIANPGRAAIMCALHPAQTNYYYFVATGGGSSIFSRTLTEHNAAIASIKAGRS